MVAQHGPVPTVPLEVSSRSRHPLTGYARPVAQEDQGNRHYWREYPLTRAGANSQVLVQTAAWFAIGIVMTLLAAGAAALFIGVLSEQAARPDGPGIQLLSDLVGLMVMVSLALGWIVWLTACVALCARDIGVSAALVQVAREGAPRTAVPHPRQVKCIIRRRFRELWWTILVSAVTLSVIAVLFLAIVLGGERRFLAVLLGIAGPAIVLWILFYVVQHVLPGRHARRRKAIASYWTDEDEEAAWSASRTKSQRYEKEKGKRNPTVARGRTFSMVATAVGGFAYSAAYVITLAYQPSRLSAERELSQALDLASLRMMWVVLACFVVAVVLAMIGLILQQVGRRAEVAGLHSSVVAPGRHQPSLAIIKAYSRPHSPPWFRVVVASSAICLCLGASVLVSGGYPSLSEAGSRAFDSVRLVAIAITVAALTALAAAFIVTTKRHEHALGLRNELHRRYPLPPKSSRDFYSEKVVAPARLHRYAPGQASASPGDSGISEAPDRS